MGMGLICRGFGYTGTRLDCQSMIPKMRARDMGYEPNEKSSISAGYRAWENT